MHVIMPFWRQLSLTRPILVAINLQRLCRVPTKLVCIASAYTPVFLWRRSLWTIGLMFWWRPPCSSLMDGGTHSLIRLHSLFMFSDPWLGFGTSFSIYHHDFAHHTALIFQTSLLCVKLSLGSFAVLFIDCSFFLSHYWLHFYYLEDWAHYCPASWSSLFLSVNVTTVFSFCASRLSWCHSSLNTDV